MSEQTLLQQREKLARSAMLQALQNQAEYSVELFIQHHLEEIEAEYWQKHLGTTMPTPLQVLAFLVLDHQSEDDLDSYEMLDFTLPEDVTNYVICVSFDAQGNIVDISMES